jgi:shikimate kinase
MSETARNLRENIVLVGFMGSGKSSIGRSIAKRLGYRFLDSDQVVIERARRPIAQIFAEEGEDKFRDLETSALASLREVEHCVIATGGGAVLRESNRRLLRELGFVACLKASEEVIFRRVSRTNKRPLLRTENPRETLHKLLTERQAAYEETAQFTLDTTNLTQPEAAETIMEEARRAFLWNRAP